MKKILFIALLTSTNFLFGQRQSFVSSDIPIFWKAFDKITTTSDTALQRKYLRELYLDQGSPGLHSLLQVRNYTDIEILNSILKYPNFWKSLRKASLNTHALYPDIARGISGLKKIYPELKPSTIYFLMGAFRTGGTTQQDRVLIGSELSLGDETTVINEHPASRQNFYKNYQPKKNIALLCTHEYIHTQQHEPPENLLSWCLYEGVAEFVSCLATAKKSNTPAIHFGKANQERVFKKFNEELFFPNWDDWLWSENTNELKERDLGYYIGYEISERYYRLSRDKQKAIKELIQLDYSNEKEVERIVDATKVFPDSLKKMWEEYNKKRPTVLHIAPLQTGTKLKPGIVQLAITFSEPMDTTTRGFDYGPLGEKHIYRLKRIIGWSNNATTFTIEVEVDAGKQYQTYITSNFRNRQGIRLRPYLMDFDTEGNK
ncbi:MAG: hypothetical protein NTW29_22770 [Bacteroidetes bacterium]|nr:hypothetical protein [Bacteroidota bacterium]